MFDEVTNDWLLGAEAALAAFPSESLSALSRDDLLELTVRWESIGRRLPLVDHAIVGELDRRGTHADLGERSAAVLLSRLIHLDPGEANRRVRAARDLGERVGLSGERLEPIFARVAQAQAGGQISPSHAAVITKAVDELPAEVALTEEGRVEQALVAQARDCTPNQLAVLARRIHDHLNPDGVLTSDADRQRHRAVTLTARRDGTGRLDGVLTPACLAAWQAVTDSLAAPRPGEDGTPDPRSSAQRMHDAFGDAAERLLRSGALPDTGGVPVTIIAAVDAADLVAGHGRARTTHGAEISVNELLAIADEAEIVTVVQRADSPPHRMHLPRSPEDQVSGPSDQARSPSDQVSGPSDQASGPSDQAHSLNDPPGSPRVPASGPNDPPRSPPGTGSGPSDQAAANLDARWPWQTHPAGRLGGVLSYERDRRCASPGQRLALIARDGGCSFPGCSVPAQWTQAHHVIGWTDGGVTSIENMTLLCGHHHRSFRAAGWECEMINAEPYWRPPSWIDRERRLRRNATHHLPIEFGPPSETNRHPLPARLSTTKVTQVSGVPDVPGNQPGVCDPSRASVDRA